MSGGAAWQDYTPPAAQSGGWQDFKAPAPNAGLAPPAGPSEIAGTARKGQTSPEAAATMRPSYLGQALHPEGDIQNPQQPAESFALAHPEEQGKLAAASAIGAAGSTPAAIPALRYGARKIAPLVVPAAASYAISKARDLPIVGPVINRIPFAEMLPWMMTGKSEAKPEPVYPGANLPEDPGVFPGANLPEHPGVFPGAPEPTATAEQLNPAIASESRTLPGQIGKEVIRPATPPARIASPAPIPERRGLALPPGPEEAAPAIAKPNGKAASGDPIAKRLLGHMDRIQAEGHGDELPEPVEATPETTNLNTDLTPALKASLARVRAAKAARIARPN
jgi:hypothetical protein